MEKGVHSSERGSSSRLWNSYWLERQTHTQVSRRAEPFSSKPACQPQSSRPLSGELSHPKMHLHKGIQSVCSQKGTICGAVWRQRSVCVKELTKMIFSKKTAELWMWAHWCVKSHLIKAGKRLRQWTVPVHLIKSTCTWGVGVGGGVALGNGKQSKQGRCCCCLCLCSLPPRLFSGC